MGHAAAPAGPQPGPRGWEDENDKNADMEKGDGT